MLPLILRSEFTGNEVSDSTGAEPTWKSDMETYLK